MFRCINAPSSGVKPHLIHKTLKKNTKAQFLKKMFIKNILSQSPQVDAACWCVDAASTCGDYDKNVLINNKKNTCVFLTAFKY